MSLINRKILIIGSGPSAIGNENEADGAAFQIIGQLARHHFDPVIIDDNAFAVTLTELPASKVIVRSISYENVYQAIQEVRPGFILPILGGSRAVFITQQLLERGVLSRYQVKIWGISLPALRTFDQPLRFSQVIQQCHLDSVPSKIVTSVAEAKSVAVRWGWPVIIKALAPRYRIRRRLCKNKPKLLHNVKRYLTLSQVHQCILEPDITGYQEFSMVGLQDNNDVQIIVSGLEDVDAVGINPGDSIMVAPIQTLTDPEYQRLRVATCRIMRMLRINGLCVVHFAFNRKERSLFVTKIIPYFTREVALAVRASGYPLLQVITDFLLGKNLMNLKLSSDYDPRTKLLEPSLDHILVKMPLWPFEDIQNTDQHLGSLMQSVGASIGIGRTVEEAMLKALRSSQFSPRDVLPNLHQLDNDHLIDQLIHPQASRVLVLIEALRRHYPISDLAELTKIQPFYFYKFRRLLKIEHRIVTHPDSRLAIESAHNNGFGDGMLAETWRIPLSDIDRKSKQGGTVPTYKQIEPSAGELLQRIPIFYSSYEKENESHRLSCNSVLVIGRGGNQLGPNTSADYYTAEVLIQMRKLGFRTIIMNNNPNAISLAPHLSDKQYLEPIQIGNIMNIIRLERPRWIVIPGNRHFLLRQLIQTDPQRTIVLPPDQETGVTLPHRANLGLDFFVDRSRENLITPMRLIGSSRSTLKYVDRLKIIQDLNPTVVKKLKRKSSQIIKRSNWKGLVQVLFKIDTGKHYSAVGIRPLRTTETVFLNQVTNVNWIQMLIRLYTGQLTLTRLKVCFHQLKVHSGQMVDRFPFKQLQIPVNHGQINNNQAVGARLLLRGF